MPVELRPAEPDDEDAVLALLADSLGHAPDARYRRLLRWKHDENWFGPSPRWVAVDGGEIVGARLFMRWRLRAGDRDVPAVQAVDTVTAATHRGQGIFRRLTEHAVDALRAEGVELIFNTPNRQSRPGYVKMGWRLAGELRPHAWARPGAAVRFVRHRAPAGTWGEPTELGEAPDAALADAARWAGLLASEDAAEQLVTDRSLGYLRWRYGDGSGLGYRVLHDDGAAAFVRVRRRGDLRELTVADAFGPRGAVRRLVVAARRASGADVVMAIRAGTAGLLPYPGGGRVLAFRPLTEDAFLDPPPFALTMGDVEIF